MKNLVLFLVFSALSFTAYSQIMVSGRLRTVYGDSVVNTEVFIYGDTASPTPKVALVIDTTNTTGDFSFVIPDVPIATEFYLSTRNCRTGMEIDTLTFTGNKVINHDLKICYAADSFKGFVYLGNQGKRPLPQQAMVYTIRKCGNTVEYLDSFLTEAGGGYRVGRYPELAANCQLIMYARLLPISADYRKYLPAYYQASKPYSLGWATARAIFIKEAVDGNVNLLLPQAQNPTGGPSTIAGYALDVHNGGPATDNIMMITDMNDVPVDYVYTDNAGRFSFTNLPFGTYKVFGDVWSRNNPPLVVKISADHVNEFDIIFTEDSVDYKGRIATSVKGSGSITQQLEAYPNPVSEKVMIKGAETLAGTKTLIIHTVTGATIRTAQFNEGQQAEMMMGDLPGGIYIIRLTTAQDNAVFRVVK